MKVVESRSYDESMTGATAKSNPTNDKLDRKELTRLQRQDYWIQVSRWKLIMDLIFVCEYIRFASFQGPFMTYVTAYNVFRWKKAKGPVQTISGLAAALLR